MGPMDPANMWRCLLHLARPCQYTSHCCLGNDPLLHWSSSCMRSHFWDHPIHFTTIFGHHFRSNRCRWKLRVRTDAANIFLNLEIFHSGRSFLDGSHDRGLHSSREPGSFPPMGWHVPSTFKRCKQIHRRTLLLLRVERGRKETGHALRKSQVCGEQPV